MPKQLFKDAITGKEAVGIVCDLLAALSCGVCNRVLTAEMQICHSGHAVCATCKPPFSRCPVCQKPYKGELLGLLSAILQQLPRQCCHGNCPALLMPDDGHNLWCGFKQTTCQLCRWSGSGNDISSHISHSHLDTMFLGEDNNSVSWEDFDPNLFCRKVLPVLAGGQFFWSITKNDPSKKILLKEYIWVPNGMAAMKIRIKVTFQDQNSTTSNTSSKTLILPASSENDKAPIVIATSILQSFIDKERVLHWVEQFDIEEIIEEKPKIPPTTLPKPLKSPLFGGVKVFPD